MLNKMRIAARLLFGFGVMMLFLAGLSGFAIYSGKTTGTALQDVMRSKDNEVLDQQVEWRLYQARMSIWRYLATADDTSLTKAHEALKIADEKLADLTRATFVPANKAKVEVLSSALASYERVALRFSEVKTKAVGLDAPEVKMLISEAGEHAARIDSVGAALSDAYKEFAQTKTTSADEQINATINASIIIGIASLLLGAILSFAISRSIVGPVKAMTAAMGRLARGDLTAVIPAANNKDEIGDMAAAVQVFKDNAIRVDQLTREQEEAEARSAAERRQAMQKMADDFENSVMGVVTIVSSSAAKMRTTAQSMSAAATQASAQATTVGAAAGQATSNVQTVASAAEELSSSITEISRQVAEAARSLRRHRTRRPAPIRWCWPWLQPPTRSARWST